MQKIYSQALFAIFQNLCLSTYLLSTFRRFLPALVVINNAFFVQSWNVIALHYREFSHLCNQNRKTKLYLIKLKPLNVSNKKQFHLKIKQSFSFSFSVYMLSNHAIFFEFISRSIKTFSSISTPDTYIRRKFSIGKSPLFPRISFKRKIYLF